jgi:hypothetical protein
MKERGAAPQGRAALVTGPGFRGLSQRIDKSWLPNPPQAAAQNLKLRDATWALIEPGLANTIPAMLAPE